MTLTSTHPQCSISHEGLSSSHILPGLHKHQEVSVHGGLEKHVRHHSSVREHSEWLIGGQLAALKVLFCTEFVKIHLHGSISVSH